MALFFITRLSSSSSYILSFYNTITRGYFRLSHPIKPSGNITTIHPEKALPTQLTEKDALEIGSYERDKLKRNHKISFFTFITETKPSVTKFLIPTYVYIKALSIYLQDKKRGKSQTIHATLEYGFYPGNVSTYFRFLNPHPFDPEDWNIMLSHRIPLQHISKAPSCKNKNDIKIIPFNTQPKKRRVRVYPRLFY